MVTSHWTTMKNTTKGAALLAVTISASGLSACSTGSSNPASYVGVCLDPYTHVRVLDSYCYGNSYYSRYHRRPMWGYFPAGVAYAGVGQAASHYVTAVPKGKSSVNGGLPTSAGKVTSSLLKKATSAKSASDLKSSKASASATKTKIRDKVKAKASSAKAKVQSKISGSKKR